MLLVLHVLLIPVALQLPLVVGQPVVLLAMLEAQAAVLPAVLPLLLVGEDNRPDQVAGGLVTGGLVGEGQAVEEVILVEEHQAVVVVVEKQLSLTKYVEE